MSRYKSYSQFVKESMFVPLDSVYTEPNLPQGWTASQINMSGTNIGQMPAQDADVSRNAYNNWRAQRKGYQQTIDTIVTDFVGNMHSQPIEEMQLDSLDVLRMYSAQDGQGVDIYIRFVLNENEHWGVFKRYGVWGNTRFYCDSLRLGVDKKFEVKLVGLIKRELINWFKPKVGEYKALKDFVVYDEFGRQKTITAGWKVNMTPTYENDDSAVLAYKGTEYTIKKPTYYFLNYWLEPIVAKPLETQPVLTDEIENV